jgi:hypothetical protein
MRWSALLLLGAVSCSSNVDLTGAYLVTAESANPTGCGPGTPVTPPTKPYVQFDSQDFFGATLITAKACTSATDTTGCNSIGLLEEPIDDGWKGETSVASGGGTSPCFLSYILATATLVDGTLHFESTTYEDSVTLDAASCIPKEATNRGTSMPCKEYQSVTATKQ